MSLRLLEPWERRMWAEMEHRGKRAAKDSASEWCSFSPDQLREEIEGLKANFRTNWRQIAYLEGHLQIADGRYRGKRHLGASLSSHLEAAKTKSLKEWI
jgi:hypothetical protein